MATNTVTVDPGPKLMNRGLLASYGAFQEYYQTVLLISQSPSSISWVGSVQATLIVMVGVVTGPLVDLGYLLVLITVGMTLVVFGIMMTSLATQYYQVGHHFSSP